MAIKNKVTNENSEKLIIEIHKEQKLGARRIERNLKIKHGKHPQTKGKDFLCRKNIKMQETFIRPRHSGYITGQMGGASSKNNN